MCDTNHISEANSEEALARRLQLALVYKLEEEIKQLPQANVRTEHTFGPGFYARTIFLDAGTTLTGKVHATEHIFIVSSGEIALTTDRGPLHVKAPYQAVCAPGTKRAGHAITDVICTNVHITKETDFVALESELIIKDDTLGVVVPGLIGGAS